LPVSARKTAVRLILPEATWPSESPASARAWRMEPGRTERPGSRRRLPAAGDVTTTPIDSLAAALHNSKPAGVPLTNLPLLVSGRPAVRRHRHRSHDYGRHGEHQRDQKTAHGTPPCGLSVPAGREEPSRDSTVAPVKQYITSVTEAHRLVRLNSPKPAYT